MKVGRPRTGAWDAIAWALLIACPLPLVVGAAAHAVERPNVLFIAIDDQNDWIGCLGGHPDAKTPHIDALAARGTLFRNAHCQAPLCNPSRTSLLTGRRPSSTGIYGLAPWIRDVPDLAQLPTLPRHLRQAGYRAYSTGKIFHGGYGRRPADAEFDELGPPAGVGAQPPAKLVQTPNPHPLVDWGVFPHRDEDKGDWIVAQAAIERLEQGFDEPFFLSVGFFLPHVPCYVTQPWYDLHADSQVPPVLDTDRDDTPRFSWYLHWRLPEPRLKFLRESGEWENLVRSYLASTSFVDAQIGRLLDALEASGHADDTIVVLWSDHGWHLGEKLITGKNSLWEESTHVPLVFAGPGITPGAVCDEPAELLDIFPTLIELLDLPRIDALEGHSLVPQLREPTTPRPWPAITTHNAGNHSARDRHHRLIRYADGTREFYDLTIDPQEQVNRIADPRYADVIERLTAALPSGDLPPAPGSQHRILTLVEGVPVWEGEPILLGVPIPEIDD